MDNSIVLIGGMGPQASLELHRLLLAKVSETVDKPDEYPNILHASIAVPDFISDSQSVDRAIKLINQTCQSIPLADSAAVGLACNTAHLLLDELNPLSLDQFVSMIDCVCDDAVNGGYASVGLLASPHTIRSGLYADRLESRGVQVITPSEPSVTELESIIRSLIAGTSPQQLHDRLTTVATELVAKGAECIVLGCTELPMIGVDCAVPTISSLQSLANQLMLKWEAN